MAHGGDRLSLWVDNGKQYGCHETLLTGNCDEAWDRWWTLWLNVGSLILQLYCVLDVFMVRCWGHDLSCRGTRAVNDTEAHISKKCL